MKKTGDRVGWFTRRRFDGSRIPLVEFLARGQDIVAVAIVVASL